MNFLMNVWEVFLGILLEEEMLNPWIYTSPVSLDIAKFLSRLNLFAVPRTGYEDSYFSTSSPTLDVVEINFCQSNLKHVLSLGHFCALAFCTPCSICTDRSGRADGGEKDLVFFCVSLVTREVEHPFLCAYRSFRFCLLWVLFTSFIFHSVEAQHSTLSCAHWIAGIFHTVWVLTFFLVLCVSIYSHSVICVFIFFAMAFVFQIFSIVL